MLRNLTTGETIASRVVHCDTIWRRGLGLMFRASLPEDEVYLFTERTESVIGAAIHMFFVFFEIGVIWLDRDKCVVDMILARPFRPYYAPSKPAQYYVEGRPVILEQLREGDLLDFDH